MNVNHIPPNEPRYTRTRVLQLANVSVEFLERCEAEQLIEVSISPGVGPRYSVSDIRQLVIIRRLHEILGINFQDLEVVLHLRNQLLDLRLQMDEMEQQRIEREEQLLRELADLRRRLSEGTDRT